MLAPMTVKNIPITMTIAAQLTTWMVAIARFEILERMRTSEPGALWRPCGVSPISSSSTDTVSPDDPLSTGVCRNMDAVDPIVPTGSMFVECDVEGRRTEAVKAINLLRRCTRHNSRL